MLLFDEAELSGSAPMEMLPAADRLVAALEFSGDGPSNDPGAANEPDAAEDEEEQFDDSEQRLAAIIEAARVAEADKTRKMVEAEMEQRFAVEHARIEVLSREFKRDRERYFAAAETQVVRLALAVARRVLCREAAADPMHLEGSVKAALAQLNEEECVTLTVAPGEVERWNSTLASSGSRSITVLSREDLAGGECVLVTKVGRVELGVEPQLKEIERGFTDLLQRS